MPVGVTTRKKTIPITIGDTIFPRSNANLNHNLFNGVKKFELINPKNKKTNDIYKDQLLICCPSIKGHNDIIANTAKKTNPKLRLEPILTCEFLGIVY